MSRSFEQQEPWGDVPRVPDELGSLKERRIQQSPQGERSSAGNEEVHGDIPRLPEEIREDFELREPGMLGKAVREAGVV